MKGFEAQKIIENLENIAAEKGANALTGEVIEECCKTNGIDPEDFRNFICENVDLQEIKELQRLEELSFEELDRVTGGAPSVKQGIASFLAATSLLGSAANLAAKDVNAGDTQRQRAQSIRNVEGELTRQPVQSDKLESLKSTKQNVKSDLGKSIAKAGGATLSLVALALLGRWALLSNKATEKASQQESTPAVDKAKAATIDEFTKGIGFKKDNIIELSGIKTEDDFMQQIGKDNIDVLVTKPYSDSGKNWITIYIMSSKKEFWGKIANELRKSSDICAFFNFDWLARTGFCSWWSDESSFENSLDSQTIAARLVVRTINAFDKDVRVAIADMNDYYIDNFMRTENVTLRNNLVAKFDANRKRKHSPNDFNNTSAPIAPSASLPVVSYSSSRAAIPAKSDVECSKSIVKKMVADISLRLTSSNGMYRLKNVKFSDETIQNMASYITSNSIKQGRAKDDLSDKIYGLCVTNLQEYKNRSVEIVYTPSVEPEGLGNFTGRILEEPKFAHHSPFKGLVDYSEMDRSFIDYSELDTSFVDYSEN